jgi:EpsI family protein
LTAYGIYSRSTVSDYHRSVSLSESIFPALPSWSAQERLSLSERVVEALELDDYVNRYLSNGRETLSLYIGFYTTQKKVGAAHSPLVCFPGQGWDLSGFSDLKVQAGQYTVNLASMVIGKGEEQQLVLYWFQAYDRTTPGTFMQKIYLLRAKFIHGREDNAFVRVMIPFGTDRTRKEAQKIGVQFIQEFYPVFYKVITQ